VVERAYKTASAAMYQTYLYKSPPWNLAANAGGIVPVRRTKDNTYMQMAMAASKLSTCERAHHGAVITVEDRVVGIGYNGAPRGLPHCSDVGCHISEGSTRCERSIHAETNALINANRSVAGGTIYVTGEPCERDAGLIVQAGLARVVINSGQSYFGSNEALANEVRSWYQTSGIRFDIID
jgi:dCMP deaminase